MEVMWHAAESIELCANLWPKGIQVMDESGVECSELTINSLVEELVRCSEASVVSEHELLTTPLHIK